MSKDKKYPRVEAGISRIVTQGNICSIKERSFRLIDLKDEIKRRWVDKEIIPYLKRINSYLFLVTTQSCCGHNESMRDGRRSHIDFRSLLNEADTINRIIRPFINKRNPPDCAFELMVEPYGIRYILWLRNDKWKEQLEDFISVLKEVNYE